MQARRFESHSIYKFILNLIRFGIRLHSAGRGSACKPNPSNPTREHARSLHKKLMPHRGIDFLALIVVEGIRPAPHLLARRFESSLYTFDAGFSRRLACKLVASNPILFTNLFLT